MAFLELMNSANFNLFSFGELINNEQAALQAVHSLGLIPEHVDCPSCDFRMSREEKSSFKLGYRWICNRRACNRIRINPLKGTFFENTKISFVKALRLLVCWYFRIPVTQANIHCEVHVETAVRFYSSCREVCTIAHGHDEQQVGGPGDVVECDECHIFKPKYHRGRPTRLNIWVFGGISRLTKKRFAAQIPRKDRDTLFPLMQQHIAQGSFIMTDEARVYRDCKVLGFSGHRAVNHSRTFVSKRPALVPNGNPRLGSVLRTKNVTSVKVHCNTLEGTWNDLKNGFLRQCRSIDMVPNHIGEYLYRRNHLDEIQDHKRNQGKRLLRFIQDIKRVYPGSYKKHISLENCECEDCA